MAINIAFATHFPWNRPNPNAPSSNRPYAEVHLHGPNQTVRLWCLVDSGADRIQVHTSNAQIIGYSLGNAVQRQMQTASGGTTKVYEVQNLTMAVEGTQIVDACYFGSNQTPILGRVTFLNAFDVGFDQSGWMRS